MIAVTLMSLLCAVHCQFSQPFAKSLSAATSSRRLLAEPTVATSDGMSLGASHATLL